MNTEGLDVLQQQFDVNDEKIGNLYDEQETIFLSITKTLFKTNPQLKSITIKGTTPSFNDGDACLHSQYVSFNGFNEYRENEDGESFDDTYDEDGDEDDSDDEEDEDEEDDTEDNIEENADAATKVEDNESVETKITPLSNEDFTQISQIINKFEHILEIQHGTNWKLTITPSKDNPEEDVEIEHEHYHEDY